MCESTLVKNGEEILKEIVKIDFLEDKIVFITLEGERKEFPKDKIREIDFVGHKIFLID